jgi:hypothetical protein
VENTEDILATLRVETRRVAVRSTDWLGATLHAQCIEKNAEWQKNSRDTGSKETAVEGFAAMQSNPALPWRTKTADFSRVKYWKIIADQLSEAGWSWGCVSAIGREGRTIWNVDAHRDDRKRFVVSHRSHAILSG